MYLLLSQYKQCMLIDLWSIQMFTALWSINLFIAVIARNDIVDIYSESMISSGHHLNYKYNKLYNKMLVLLLISPRVDQYCDW
jgi:hypothetical protein